MAYKLTLIAATIVASTFTINSAQAASGTLNKVLTQGTLSCGVSTGLPGFSNPNARGEWEGIDVEYCQAVAAAVLGDKTKVKYVPLTAKERFTALQSGEVDILSRNTTWTLHRDTALGLTFVGTNYYDGQGFMVKKELGIHSAKELDGASVCVQAGTTTELNLADYFRTQGMSYKPVVFDTTAQTARGFDSGRCDVLTDDLSGLYALRLNLSKPDSATVLPEVISKEPLGPVVRQDDDRWFNIAKWTLFAMINAEEYGITSANADQMLKSENPDVKRILGVDGPKGQALGLRDDWGYQIIKQVGNYGESFERTVGKGSPLQIARGANALWNAGGFMYAPPIR
ncbi:amino acid ABC transporter substrate-binding protein [Vibrio cincinnatiensis]|uniref:Amino acid ABC transporter substrate-binding protein, PAAT family (TC 3.A.1.3.-) n=1 Tax=Vibrio cincinnatiensis DSM 19608 TaxID=1123491 RepID=A0A1T4RHW7_VIBCI|nr:amino acid ABC transporter substrate-binding protein [Vibrio cincinnatiensis]MCG3721283.1 amino acid ABC transporter substrate-binding protein [Vibrio cincinnatiensis]MCG3732010.1 amino acid ABC transporter substrate-binding protein [Vibrio cincinnatiensis]MCG3737393.1 amino acid ABC transporter substrate-binding protein [Vibrio cincinnatiensis]MCG3739721.1 amino acid ABC transporter substrate-binding protein [Vibrio cincinnatiensis]MCG3742659.1 amino acid ABC transporter substrate-binding 